MPEFSPNEIQNREHIAPDKTGDNIAAKRVALYVWDGISSWVRMTQPGGGAGGGGAATIADGADVAEGSTADVAYTTGSGTVVSILKGIFAAFTNGNQQVQGNAASGATDAGNPVKVGGVNNTTRPTLTNTQRGDLQVDTRGAVYVTPTYANGTNGFTGLVDNADAIAVTSVATRLAVSARNYLFNGTTFDRAPGDATNGAYVNVKAGTVAATQSGTWTVQPGNTANTTAWLTKLVGKSVSSQTALTTAATVSAAAGTYVGGSYINLNSVPSYIQVFDTTGAVTLGSTTPTFVQPVPANATAANGAAFVFDIPGGIAITNGIKIAATTTATGASTSATALIGYTIYT